MHHKADKSLSIVIPVFNEQVAVNRTVQLVAKQCADWPVEIIVVDDGSEKPIEIEGTHAPRLDLKVLRLFQNQGRSRARNVGASDCKGDFITFLDADCEPCIDYISAIFDYIHQGYTLFAGHLVFKNSNKFLEAFENKNQINRVNAGEKWPLYWTSANLTVDKNLFIAVSGFSEDYKGYGFEDRDFLIRVSDLMINQKVGYNIAAMVVHSDDVTLDEYNSKFYRSGLDSARQFATIHPKAYAEMHYSFFDVNQNKLLSFLPKKVLRSCASIVRHLASATFYRISDESTLKAKVFRVSKGLSYLLGTIDQADEYHN